jgi:hypothetical protein
VSSCQHSAAPFSGFKQPTKINFIKNVSNFNNRSGSLVQLQAICLLYTSKLSTLDQTACCYPPQTVILTSLLVSLQSHLCQYIKLCSSSTQVCCPYLHNCDTVTFSFSTWQKPPQHFCTCSYHCFHMLSFTPSYV